MAAIVGPRDFWALIERAYPSFTALELELLALDQTSLENFYGLYAVLSGDAIVEDELHYEAEDTYLSEDGIETFGWWVVTQGVAFFDALTEEKMSLQDALAMHMQEKSPRVWQAGENRRLTNFLSLTTEIFEQNFGRWTMAHEDRARSRAFELRDAEYAGA